MFPSAGADLHCDACVATKSTPCAFPRELWCTWRNQILLRYRNISSLWRSLHEAIPLLHLCFALSCCKATTQAHTQLTSNRGYPAAKALLFAGRAKNWDMRLGLPLGHCQLLCFPLRRRTWLTSLACTNTDCTESFHKGRGRARVVPGHHAGALSLTGAFFQQPNVSLSITRLPYPGSELGTKSLWKHYRHPSFQTHQILLWKKHYIITMHGFIFFLNLTFLIHVLYLKGSLESVSPMLEVRNPQGSVPGEAG